MIGRVRQDGFVDAAVIFLIGLLVACNAGFGERDTAGDWRFDKRSRPRAGFAVVNGILSVSDRPADLNGNDRGHASALR